MTQPTHSRPLPPTAQFGRCGQIWVGGGRKGCMKGRSKLPSLRLTRGACRPCRPPESRRSDNGRTVCMDGDGIWREDNRGEAWGSSANWAIVRRWAVNVLWWVYRIRRTIFVFFFCKWDVYFLERVIGKFWKYYPYFGKIWIILKRVKIIISVFYGFGTEQGKEREAGTQSESVKWEHGVQYEAGARAWSW